MKCSFCDSPDSVATSRNGRVAVCRDCADEGGQVDELLDEARGGVRGAGGGKPMVVPRLRSTADLTPAEMSLLRSAKLARQAARAEGRGLSTVETRLSLAATALENERLAVKQRAARRLNNHAGAKSMARAMVAKLGLGGDSTELGTGVPAGPRPAPRRPAPAAARATLPVGKAALKEALRDLVERAGMQAVAG
jgi:hypothetical protein